MLWRGCLLLGITLLLAACSVPAIGGGARANGNTIVFGASLSITGKTAKEGEYARDGYLMAIETINARGGIQVGGQAYTLKLKYYNDESVPERAAQLYAKLIAEDHVDFLLGPYGSTPTGAVAPVAERNRLPMVTGHGSADSIYAKGYDFVFNLQTPASKYLHGIIDLVLARDKQARTVAVLSEDDSFSREVAAGAAAYAQVKGMDVVYNEVYPSNTQDVSTLLAAVQARRVDLLLGAGHLQDALLIVRQAHALGIEPKALGLSVGPTSPEFRENLGAQADYIFGATQWTNALNYNGDDPWKTPAAFADAFIARYPYYSSVPYQSAESAASLVVFQHALEAAGTLEPLAVRDAIARTNIDTFFGHILFDARGVNSTKPMAVEQLFPDGKTYTVFPTSMAERAPIYPMPPWTQRQ